MESTIDWYASVARRYRYLAEHDSPAAAVILSIIQSDFGAHAATRAGIALTKTEVQQADGNVDASMYRILLEDYPEAIPLFERALAFCLPHWNNPVVDTVPAPADMLANPDARAFLTTISHAWNN